MWKKIKHKITQINKANGLEIYILPDDSLQISVVTGFIRKKNLEKADSYAGIQGIEMLVSKIKKEIPLAVVLNGKGVLTRKLPDKTVSDLPLSAVLPGANPADFYYQVFQNGYLSGVSVIRKEIADKILEQLTDLGFRVLSLSLGFMPLPVVLPFLKGKNETIETNSFTVGLNRENEIIDFVPKVIAAPDIVHGQLEYEIAEQYVTSSQLMSIAAAVQLLVDDVESPSPVTSTPLIDVQREEFRNYSIFKFAGIALLATLFISLLISFLVYNHYFDLNKDIQNNQPLAQQQNQKVRKLEMDIKKKEKFLQQSGWINAGKSSYYADRIAALTPAEILLTSMNIYPARSSLQSEQGNLQYKRDTIEVAGICAEPIELNQFMNGLKVLPDFKKVTIKNYQYRKESESGLFLMEIITR